MLIIYIADLANELLEIDNKSIPIGIGFVASYCKKKFGQNVDVKIFRTFKPLWDQVQVAPPDVLGLGSYDWNYNLSLNTAKRIKEINPKCLVVLGGANAEIDPNDNKAMLEAHPQIDMIVYGDGEYPFANIVDRLLKHQGNTDPIAAVKAAPIDGVRTLVDGKIVMGAQADIVKELDEIPSPYLTGIFDTFLQNPQLMPILQNIRGCPYKCRFCVSGTQSSIIRHFSYDRVTAEIEYLRANAKNRFLRLSDDNFGIIDHDVEIARYIRNSFETNEYPIGLKAYSAKKQNDRVRAVAEILSPLMIMCISFQTTSRDVQKQTLRVSATLDEAAISLDFARRRKIATGTELIFGLPGETLESWKNVINTTTSLRFDSINMNPVWLLRGADLYRPDVRIDLGYKSKVMLAENAITYENDFLSFESDEIVVSSKYFTEAEWECFLNYHFLMVVLTLFGYGRELLYHALSLGIKTTDVFDELLNHPERYPVLHEAVQAYVSKYLSAMFDSREDLQKFVNLQLGKLSSATEGREALASMSKSRMHYQFITRYIFDDEENSFLVSIYQAILRLCQDQNIEHCKDSTDTVLDLSLNMIINPRKEFVHAIGFDTKYDINSWIADGYIKQLQAYELLEAKTFTLQSRNAKTISATLQSDKENKRTDCFSFFRYMNSSLMRRFVVNPNEKPVTEFEPTPHEPWKRDYRVGSGLA